MARRLKNRRARKIGRTAGGSSIAYRYRATAEVIVVRRSMSRVMVGAVAVGTLSGSGCKDTSGQEERLRNISEPCSLNSDCENPLVCVFERCHEPCTDDRDCADGLRCVMSGEFGMFVCQLPDELECVRDKDCPGDQVCGIDEICRDPCMTASECTPMQVCATSGECASPVVDVLDAAGNIVVVGEVGTTSGTGTTDAIVGNTTSIDATTREPNPGEAESGNDDESSTSGQNPVSTADATGGSEGTSDGTEGDASSGSESTGELPDGFVETEDQTVDASNDRSAPTPLTQHARIVVPEGDEDWFAVTVPDSGRGWLLRLTAAQEPMSSLSVSVRTSIDFDEIGGDALGAGETASVHVTVGSGTTTLFGFTRWPVSSVARADLTVEMIEEDDPHEPNDTLLDAAPIAPNTDVHAFISILYVSDADRTTDDWFRVELGAGEATVQVDSIPTDTRMHVHVFDGDGRQLPARVTTEAQQVRATLELGEVEAGTYYVRFAGYVETGMRAYALGRAPGYMTDPYRFRVVQAP